MAGVVIAIVVVLVVVGVLLARRGAASAAGRVDARLAALDVQRQAKASLDGSRGVLALTPSELVFIRFVPDEELRWPRAGLAATAADGTLRFVDGDDTRTVAVDDAPGWEAALRSG